MSKADYDITPEMVGMCRNIIMDYCRMASNKCEDCALRVTCQRSFKIPPFAWKKGGIINDDDSRDV